MGNRYGTRQHPYTIKAVKDIAVVLLAAGAGSRMGQIKQLLPWRGTTLLEHSLKTLASLDRAHIHLVLGAHFEAITEACALQNDDTTILKNPFWEHGLASSLQLGASHVATKTGAYTAMLVCLADQPLFTADYFRQMISLFKKGDHPIIATGYGQKSGVPAIFHKDLLAELLTLEGDRGAQTLMQRHKSKLLVLDAGEMNQDVDTLERYKMLYELHHNP
jgi:molybdenum cofactor cytidylyltransferase